MRADALAEVDTLPDVERQRVQAVEAVHARGFRNRIESVRRELRRKARRLERAANRGFDVVERPVAIDRLHERPQDARVAERAVTMVRG